MELLNNTGAVWSFSEKAHTPLSQFPGGAFPSVGMIISIEVPMGIENLLFSTQKASGDDLRAQFFNLISNGDKIIGQFPSGVEISG